MNKPPITYEQELRAAKLLDELLRLGVPRDAIRPIRGWLDEEKARRRER